MSPDNRQSAYHLERIQDSGDVDRDIYDAFRVYLVDVGIAEPKANQRAVYELFRKPG